MTNRGRKRALRKQRVAYAKVAAPTGRPRLEGPRQACGRLKPPTPNPVVVAQRRVLLSKPDAKGVGLRDAENALDLLLARGWLPVTLHHAAREFRSLYAATFPRLPDLRVSAVEEAPGADDHPLERGVRLALMVPQDGDPVAMAVLRAVWRVLAQRPGTGQALVEVLQPGFWPGWLVAMVEGRGLSVLEKDRRAAFFLGLHLVSQVTNHPAARAA